MSENFQPYDPNDSMFSEEPAHYHYQPETKKPPRKKGGGRMIAIALCFSLLGGILGAGGTLLLSQNLEPDLSLENRSDALIAQREYTRLELNPVNTGTLMTPAEVYAANVNSTVGITTSITTNYWGFQTTSAASGSGFIITDDGYILTNYHVVESSSSISVSMYDGTAYQATLIGYDESNDIAVLKINAQNLAPVILGDSDSLNVGDSVVAIGNPLGELTFSLTAGAVSAKDRQVTFSGNVTMDLIQTDCAINSGNSGGALFNLYGEVVGITNAKYSSSGSEASIDNIGFAIPLNNVMDIVESIIEKGYISKPYIGVSVSNVSAQTQSYGIPAGAAIQSISEGSPAEEAGLTVGDIILEVNDVAIASSSELVDIIGSFSVGDELTLSIYRQGEILDIPLTVGEQIQSALANEESKANSQQSQGAQSFGRFPGWW